MHYVKLYGQKKKWARSQNLTSVDRALREGINQRRNRELPVMAAASSRRVASTSTASPGRSWRGSRGRRAGCGRG
jgi:hypothetical protein